MPTKSLIIPSFRYGLDTRRDQLVSQVGVLVECTNAFINNGGEVEKRQAFVDVFAGSSVDFTGTFGLLAVAEGFVVFADYSTDTSACASTYPTFDSINIGDLAFGLSVFKCRHPKGALGGTDTIAMTALVWALNFNGKPFVCAKFADDNCFLYYGEISASHASAVSPIDDSAMGIVYAGLTSGINLATQLGIFVADALPGWTASQTSNYVDIKSPIGVEGVKYTTLETDDPTQNITALHIDDNNPGSAGEAAGAAITITAVGNPGDVFTVSVETAVGSGIYVQIAQSTVLAGDTVTLLAARIAFAISNTIATPQCTATNTAGTVFVIGPQGDESLNGRNLKIVSNGTGTETGGTYARILTAPTFVRGTRGAFNLPGSAALVTSNKTTVSVIGTAVTAYLWTYVSGDLTIAPVSPTNATTSFKALVEINTQKSAVFKCVINGSATLASNYVTVKLTCFAQ